MIQSSLSKLKLNHQTQEQSQKELMKIVCSFFVVDTSTNEYFNGKSGLKVPNETPDFADRSSKNTLQANTQQQRKGSLAKLDAVDIVDCKYLSRSLSFNFYQINRTKPRLT